MTSFAYTCAPKKYGSEAAFPNNSDELQIIAVEKVVGNKADKSAITTFKAPKSVGHIYKLVYSDEGKLHVLHDGDKVSLFDPSTKEFTLLEAPQETRSHLQ